LALSDRLILFLAGLLFLLPLLGLRKVVSGLIHLVEGFFEFLHFLLESLLVASLRLLEVFGDVAVVVMSQAGVESFNLACPLDPFVEVSQNFSLLDIEVAADHGLKTFGRVLELAKHCPLNVTISDDIGVAFVFALTVFGTGFALESRFVKVNFI